MLSGERCKCILVRFGIDRRKILWLIQIHVRSNFLKSFQPKTCVFEKNVLQRMRLFFVKKREKSKKCLTPKLWIWC